MALEPISSIMTYQAQSLHQSIQTQKPVTDNKDVAAQETSQPVDNATIVIKDPEERNRPDENQNGQNSQNNQKTNDQIKQAVEKMNKKMMNSEVLFGIHEETNRVTIKIVDKESKEVIKELPPEKTLDMLAKALEFAGLLIDEKR